MIPLLGDDNPTHFSILFHALSIFDRYISQGTLLEAKGYDVSGSMWGSELVLSRPTVISEIHESYFEAGSDIVQTAT